MNTENVIKGAIWFFVIMVVGSLLSAVLGGAFGALVAAVSPEFVKGLFGAEAGEAVVRYSFAVGMIWGVFIGAAVSGFACFLAVAIKMLKIRFDYRKEREGHQQGDGGQQTDCSRSKRVAIEECGSRVTGERDRASSRS
ncbi:hypothetical protein ACFLSJ_08105 [Verrucomicrobiota bacterium]